MPVEQNHTMPVEQTSVTRLDQSEIETTLRTKQHVQGHEKYVQAWYIHGIFLCSIL